MDFIKSIKLLYTDFNCCSKRNKNEMNRILFWMNLKSHEYILKIRVPKKKIDF